MRLPDISPRHRRLVRAIAIAGTSGLALVRRRDFAPEQDRAVRLANAIANAGLTWVVGTQAYAGPLDGEFDLGEALGAADGKAGQPVRYSAENPSEQAERSQALRNLATALASGAVSWATWRPTQNIADAIDRRLPVGVGRGLGAAASGSFVAACAALLDKFEETESIEDFDYAPVEIELPEHLRGAVDGLLTQPHPVSTEAASAVRSQFDAARFFVWVSYSRRQYPGDGPLTLNAQQLADLLSEEEVSTIDVYPEDSSPRVVPGHQTYPVVGIQDTEASARRELTLDIVDGRLSSLNLFASDDGSQPRTTSDLPSAAKPGALYPLGLDAGADNAGYLSSFEIEDEEIDEDILTLAQWPSLEQLSFSADGQ